MRVPGHYSLKAMDAGSIVNLVKALKTNYMYKFPNHAGVSLS